MTKNKKSFLKTLHANYLMRACFFCVICSLLSTQIYAQSARRKLSGRVAMSPTIRQHIQNYELQRDIDLYVGKIVRIDGNYAIVNVSSPNKIANRQPMYYACDIKMVPTAILENANVSHRTCVTFKIINGTALVGDTVMVRYFSNLKTKVAQKQ